MPPSTPWMNSNSGATTPRPPSSTSTRPTPPRVSSCPVRTCPGRNSRCGSCRTSRQVHLLNLFLRPPPPPLRRRTRRPADLPRLRGITGAHESLGLAPWLGSRILTRVFFAPATAAKTACGGPRPHAPRPGTSLAVWGVLLDAGAAFFSELEWASTASSAMMGRTSVMLDEHGRGGSDGH
jgi:hypothetical protein